MPSTPYVKRKPTRKKVQTIVSPVATVPKEGSVSGAAHEKSSPASSAQLETRGAMGHFKVACRKSKYNKVQEQQEDSEKERSSEDTAGFLGEISDNKPYWFAKVSVDGELCEFIETPVQR